MITLSGLGLFVSPIDHNHLLPYSRGSLKLFYTAQTALAYSVGNVAHGLANNGMTDAQRAGLSLDDPEYRYRCV